MRKRHKHICLYCNKEFESEKKQAQYCSRGCAWKCYWKKRGPTIHKFVCKGCGTTFFDKKHNDREWCSQRCYMKHYWKKKGLLSPTLYKFKCSECGKAFYSKGKYRLKFKQNFCSHKCLFSYRLKHPEFYKRIRGIRGSGWKQSREAVEKTRRANLGRKHSEITRQHMSEAHRGAKSNLWRGGISYIEYSPLFNKQLREKVRVRDNFICQICGVPELELNRRLSVHHIDYNKKNNDLNNLISLCLSCHAKTTIQREKYKKLLEIKK